jgi:beta-lactamase regulating signal transducer with metallopeptidase domain
MSWNPIAETALAWGMTYALHSTLLLALALLASKALARQSPRLAEIALRGALLGSLATASVQVALGYEPLAGRFHLGSAEVASAQPESAVPAAPGTALARMAPMTRMAPAAVSTASAPRVESVATVPERSPAAPALLAALPATAVVLWGAVGLLLLAASLRNYSRLISRVRYRSQVVGGSLLESLGRLAGDGRLARRVRLTCSSRLPVPVAFRSGRRAEIALPPRALFGLTGEQQEGLLAHELAHLERRDPEWLLGGRLLASVLFFQPLNWLALTRLRELSELLADEWAVARTGRPLSLARCLTEVAGWSIGPVRALPVPGMAGGAPQLAQRVRRLLEESRTGHRPWRSAALAAVLAVLLVAVAAFAPGVAATGSKGAGEGSSAIAGEAPRPSLAPKAEWGAEDAPEPPELPDPLEVSDLAEAPEAPEAPEPPALPRAGLPHRHAGPVDSDPLTPETQARIDRLSERMGELGEKLGRLDPASPEFARLSAELGRMGGEIAGLVTPDTAALAARFAAHPPIGPEEAARLARFGEEFGKSFGKSFGKDFERRMGREDFTKLQDELAAMTARLQPSREELARMEAEVERLTAEARRDGELSAEERHAIAAQAKKIADEMRPSEEELRKVRELAGRMVEENRGEIEEAARTARVVADGARRESRRQIEAGRRERRDVAERERARAHRERDRERESRHRHDGEAPEPPAPPVPRRPNVPAPRPAPAPLEELAPAPAPPVVAPRAAVAPRPMPAPGAVSAPHPAVAPRALPALPPVPAPRVPRAAPPLPPAPPAPEAAPAPPEPPADIV